MQQRINPELATLGTPLGQYRSAPYGVYFLIAFLLCGTAFLAVESFHQPSPHLPSLLFALLTLGCALAFCVHAWNRPSHLRLFAYGLLVERLAGRIMLPWDVVQQCTITTDRSYGETLVTCVLTARYAKPIQIRAALGKCAAPDQIDPVPFMPIEAVIDVIITTTQPFRLGETHARYQQGAWVDFTPIRVSAVGIQVQQAMLPWFQVTSLHTNTDQTILAIGRVGHDRPWRIVRLDALANRDIFAPLLATYHPRLVAGEAAETSRRQSD